VLLGGAGVMDGEQLGVEEKIFQLGSHVRQEGWNHQVHAWATYCLVVLGHLDIIYSFF